MIVLVQEEREPYSSTGTIFRAYRKDWSSLFVGEERRDRLVERVRSYYPDAMCVSGCYACKDNKVSGSCPDPLCAFRDGSDPTP